MDAYSMSVTSAARKTQSRIYQDLRTSRLNSGVKLSLDKLLARNLSIMDRVLKYESLDPNRKSHVGVVGAGLAGLRCADLLLGNGFRVTVLEARNRLGGRLHQERLPNGHLIDIGPNWIHGTKDNPIMDLTTETSTTVGRWDTKSYVFDEAGELLSMSDGTSYSTIVWDIIEHAFEYSNKYCSEIDPAKTLKDFFQEQVPARIPETEDDYEKKRHTVLQLSELWGAFVGSPIEKQSLKFFWLEECIDGGMCAFAYRGNVSLTSHTRCGAENLFCAGTYHKILERIAQPVIDGADIKYQTRVSEIHGKSIGASDIVRVKTTHGQILEFDEVVLTTPLGWLKKNQQAFSPPLPERLSQAINNIGYGCLEKVYISFTTAFWLNPGADGRTVQGFCQWLAPSYAPDSNPERWTNEIVELGSLDPSVAHPTLLFYIYGDESQYVTSTVRSLSGKGERDKFLLSFFKPYYSRLPSYKEGHPDCQPAGCFSTDWLHDELAGNGSYCNFQAGLQEGDKDILAMRTGIPTEGIWLAGEHTAPFVALGTVTGAYWSGEDVARRIAQAYGRGKAEKVLDVI
ncbi:hypothetical protein B0H67DRAFT_663433 [Lasiosphaeris hirsuta]|uniref:Amine oxidase domain-containing protein n=1 Tax=Lasiosphaeris hirsuta TaxID=260670 RepID=A0AA40DYZ1_9PEZI|nr:hypothetical protein B0H67DRAFT_663433 [Lasiosphaeris hirsuta]